jgi:hypothetical protein
MFKMDEQQERTFNVFLQKKRNVPHYADSSINYYSYISFSGLYIVCKLIVSSTNKFVSSTSTTIKMTLNNIILTTIIHQIRY